MKAKIKDWNLHRMGYIRNPLCTIQSDFFFCVRLMDTTTHYIMTQPSSSDDLIPRGRGWTGFLAFPFIVCALWKTTSNCIRFLSRTASSWELMQFSPTNFTPQGPSWDTGWVKEGRKDGWMDGWFPTGFLSVSLVLGILSPQESASSVKKVIF